MRAHVHWFRNDLRLEDQPWLDKASKADHYFGVYILEPRSFSRIDAQSFSFRRMDLKRMAWLRRNLLELQQAHRSRGTELLIYVGDPLRVLQKLLKEFGQLVISANKEWAPEEVAVERRLELAGIDIDYSDSGGLFPMDQLFQIPEKQRKSFTSFRLFIEQNKWKPRALLTGKSQNLPPAFLFLENLNDHRKRSGHANPGLPYEAGSQGANSRLAAYLTVGKIDRYKETRNGLMGADFSSKFSLWLSLGSLSAVQINEALHKFEEKHGKSDGSYWMWFELLWREYFRLQVAVHGSKMFQRGGITNKPQLVLPDCERFKAWCQGETASDFVNAGMIELRLTGFLSNRMRQICASYLIHELQQDWRWGAAWFEAHLLDFDVHSNYGNWAYIAGAGNDPRGGRHFSIQKQQEMYDPDDSYTDFWMALR